MVFGLVAGESRAVIVALRRYTMRRTNVMIAVLAACAACPAAFAVAAGSVSVSDVRWAPVKPYGGQELTVQCIVTGNTGPIKVVLYYQRFMDFAGPGHQATNDVALDVVELDSLAGSKLVTFTSRYPFEMGDSVINPKMIDNGGKLLYIIQVVTDGHLQYCTNWWINASPVPPKPVEPPKPKEERKPERPKVDARRQKKDPLPEALERWDAQLMARMADELKGGARLTFLWASGRQRVTVLEIDKQGKLTITTGRGKSGISSFLQWSQLSLMDRKSLALSMLRDDSAEDHALAAFYMLAVADGQAQEHLNRAGALAGDVQRSFKEPPPAPEETKAEEKP